MDRSQITSNLNTARTLIGSHGIMSYMTEYNRAIATRPLPDGNCNFQFSFNLYPDKPAWGSNNPSCGLSVEYTPNINGKRTAENGDIVEDYILKITCSTGVERVPFRIMKEREALVDHLLMLCEMIEQVIPPVIAVVVESNDDKLQRLQLEKEQAVGQVLHDTLGFDAFKGLRTGGRHKYFTLPALVVPINEGKYRYRHIRRRNSRGHAVETADYVIRVHSNSLSVGRVK